MDKTIKELPIYISDGNYSSKYPRSEEFVEKGIPFIRANNLLNGDITDDDLYYITPEKHDILQKGHVKTGDVLITTRGNIGQVGIVPDRHNDSNINAQIVLLRVDNKTIFNRYLLWALQSKRAKEQYQSLQTGTALKQLPVGRLEQIKIKIVELEKQYSIANNLDRVQNIIQLRKQQLQQLDELVKARFVELFGTPLLNEKGWEVKSTGDVCSVTDGSHFSPVGKEDGYPMLSVRNMRNDGFHYDDCKLVSQEDYDILVKQGCKPLKNDVLIAKDGSYFYYGFVVKEEIEQAILSSIAILRPNLEEINPEYLCRYMLSSEIVDLVGKNYVTGAAIKRVILKGIKQIPVMLPPMELQNQFATFVEQTDKSKSVGAICIDKIQSIKGGLL